MDIDNVSWSEIIAAARLRRASLVPESAGYLMLGLIRAIGGRPLRVAPSRILLSTEGSVTLASPCRRVSAHETAETLQRILHELLSVSQEKATALRVIADGETPRLERLFSAVTKALIPINRAAARRALARLARETVRARQRGQLRPEDLPSDEDLLARGTPEPAPALLPTTPEAPACEPSYQDLATQIELATPTPEPAFRPATVIPFELALEDVDQPSPSAPSVCTGEYAPRDTMRDPIPAVQLDTAMQRIVTPTPAPTVEVDEPVLDPGVGATRPLEVPIIEGRAASEAGSTTPEDGEPPATPVAEVAAVATTTAAPAPAATPLMALGVAPTEGAPISAPSASQRGDEHARLGSTEGEVLAVGPSVVADEPDLTGTAATGDEPMRNEEDGAPIPLTVHAAEDEPSAPLAATSSPASVEAAPADSIEASPPMESDRASATAGASAEDVDDAALREKQVPAVATTVDDRLPKRSPAFAANHREVADELGLAERLKGQVAQLPAARRRHGSALLGRSHTVEDLLDDFAEDGDAVVAVAASLKSMMELSPTPPPGTSHRYEGAPKRATDTVSGLALERDVFQRDAGTTSTDDAPPPNDLPAPPHDEDEDMLELAADGERSAVSARIELLEAAEEEAAEEHVAPARETRPNGTLPAPAPEGLVTPRALCLDAPEEEEAVPSVSPPPVASESHDDDSLPPPSDELPIAPRRGRLVAGMVAVAAIAAGSVAIQQRPDLLDRVEAVAAPVLERVVGPEKPAGQCRADVRLAELPPHHEVLSFLGTTPVQTDALPRGVRLELMVMANGRLPERVIVPADATWSPQGELRLAVELEQGSGTHWPSAPAGTVGGKGPAGHITVESGEGPAEVWLVIASGEGADHVVPLPCDQTARLLVVDTDDPSRQRRIEVGADLLSTAARAGGADVAARP